MTDDGHQIRMQVGNGAATMLDALDDETLALFEPAAQAIGNLVDQLKSKGLPSTAVLQVLVGAYTAAAFHDETQP